MTPHERQLVLDRYRQRTRLFDEIAARRSDLAAAAPEQAASLIAAEFSGSGLSPREIQVLALIAHGDSNAEIGERLMLSPETIKTHVRRIIARLNARNRAHAVTLGIGRGLITVSSSATPPALSAG